jgi:very-short-patch-repair endonuclease
MSEPAIARIAAAQHGVVTRAQLVAAGLSHDAVDHRMAQGRLHPVHRGVYLVGHPVPPQLAKEMAAVLACGKGAVLSHQAAACLWGFGTRGAGEIDITVPSRSYRSRPGIRIHGGRNLDHRDVRRRSQIPLTAPARTLLDLAEAIPSRDLHRAYEEAQRGRLLRPVELGAMLERSPGRHGVSAIRALLDEISGPALTRSEAEALLLELLRAAELSPTGVNVRVGRHEVDLLWRPQRLIVEVDGYAYHASRAAFERDRLRDAELQAAGYRVMRVTWRQITDRPEAVIARVAQALAAPAYLARA